LLCLRGVADKSGVMQVAFSGVPRQAADYAGGIVKHKRLVLLRGVFDKALHIGLLQRRLKFGQDGLLARGANDAPARLSTTEINESWHGLDFVPKTEIKAVIGIDLDDFDLSAAGGGQFLKHGIESLTWTAPGRKEGYKNRLF